MVTNQSPSEIRELVLLTLSRLRSMMTTAEDVEEILLIQDGSYMGRSYRANDSMAMWMPSVALVQFYDADGQLIYTINLTSPPADQLQAA